jgi:UDP:flavonoid glycosyltransferase YjiC (YdhE family)
MRLLFTSFPAYGHLHPMMPLALAAIERGDDVVVATGPNLAGWVSACGVPATSAGGGFAELGAEARARFDHAWVGRMFTTIAVPRMVSDLLDLSTRWRPDVIVHEESECAAPLVAELLDVPCVTHSWAAPAKPWDERTFLLRLLEPIWAERGAGVPRLFGSRYLDACPPPFQTQAIHSIPGVRPIRPVLFDGPATSPPAWLAALKRPSAYVSFGTIGQFSRPDVLQAAIDAVSPVVSSAVITTGPNPTDCLHQPPPQVFVEQYVPQSVVLPRVDVVVSHGGAGTTLGAIMHGLPHVVLPQNPWSQRRTAERVAALGIGIHVEQDHVESLRDIVVAALTDPTYKEAALRTRDTLFDLPSPDVVLSQVVAKLA